MNQLKINIASSCIVLVNSDVHIRVAFTIVSSFTSWEEFMFMYVLSNPLCNKIPNNRVFHLVEHDFTD